MDMEKRPTTRYSRCLKHIYTKGIEVILLTYNFLWSKACNKNLYLLQEEEALKIEVKSFLFLSKRRQTN